MVTATRERKPLYTPRVRPLLLPSLVVVALCACDGASVLGARDAAVDAIVADIAPIDASVVLAFGRGFTDLTGPVERDAPFRIPAPTREMFTTDDLVAHVGDVDGDGRDEVVISHYETAPMGRAAPYAVYRYERAAKVFARADVRLPEMPALAGVLDLDGDGRDDLLAFDRDRALAWGDAGGFLQPDSLDPLRLDWGTSSRITSYFLDDLDDDGWLDLLVATDCCRSPCRDLHALVRTGPRSFRERPAMVSIEQVSKPYAAFAARFAPGERVLMSVGWSCIDPNGAPVFYRSVAPDAEGFPRHEAFDPTPPMSYFRGPQVGFPTIAFNSPMAACADDLDDDGRLDLAVALNPIHQLFHGTARWPFEDATARSSVALTRADSRRDMIPWSMVFIDLDRDARLDWVIAHGNDQTAWFDTPERFIGPQYVGAYQGLGELRFREVTPLVNLQRRGQWRTLAFEDWDDDGDADLTVGGQHELPRLYRNDIENGNHGVVLRLHGTTSNHLAVGAWITAWVTETAPPLRRYVGGVAHAFSVQEPFVTLGLGAATRVARLRIAWPSGAVQELRDLAADRAHAITEPSSFTVTPSTRRAPADGRSTIEVLVTPRSLDGTLRADARVALSLAGSGSLAGPVTQSADGWRARLVAPSQPGSAVVTVRIDDVALAVHPRVWWE